jgi:hypothetical protein
MAGMYMQNNEKKEDASREALVPEEIELDIPY